MAKDSSGRGKGPIIDLAAENVSPAKPAPEPPGAPDAKPRDPETPQAKASAGSSPSAPAGTAAPPPPKEPARAKGASPLPMALFALLGAALAVAIVLLLARGGYLTRENGSALADSVVALESRLAVAEQQVSADASEIAALRDDLAGLRQQLAENAGAPAGLDSRLATIEERVAALGSSPPAEAAAEAVDLAPLTEKVASLENALQALSADVAARPDEARIAAIEARLDTLASELAKVAGVAPAIVADALAAAVDAGAPFATELAALRRYDLDPETLAGLEGAAATGVPTLARLRAGFDAAIATVDLTTHAPESAGAVERLLESARSLVEVRPAGPVAGDDPPAVVARIRAALAAGDLDAALADWAKLPPGAQNATADWQRAAALRNSADRLVRRLRSEAVSSLASED